MEIILDFRLLEVSMELSTLEKHLELIEAQIERGQEEAWSRREAKMMELESDDEAEWSLIVQEYDYEVDFVLPRVLRNPFLVSLFAVYESTVTEIAKAMQQKKSAGISIDDLKGDFLKHSKNYYGHVLQFQLSLSNDNWQRLMLLSDLRNAIAHTNGRLDPFWRYIPGTKDFGHQRGEHAEWFIWQCGLDETGNPYIRAEREYTRGWLAYVTAAWQQVDQRRRARAKEMVDQRESRLQPEVPQHLVPTVRDS